MYAVMATSISQGQLVINEFVADNDSGIQDPLFGKNSDWIEIYNANDHEVNMGGMYLSDQKDLLMKWVIPTGTSIAARGYLIIWADGENIGLHTNFGLNRSGEYLALVSSMGLLIDSLTFMEQIQDVSYGRSPDGEATWTYFPEPTPGSSNSTQSGDQMVDPPVFTVARGFYTGVVNLDMLTSELGAVIRYTLDGSDPDASAKVFNQTIRIDTTTVVKARQYLEGKLPSPTVIHTYIMDETTTLPVFSLSTDPDNLWDPDRGIYVEGRNYVWGWGNGNFWQDWEREAYVEFFESDRKLKLNQNAALKITGALSRTASQKSLRLIAKGSLGEPKFDYRFFKDKRISAFNDIVLRSSGNDWASTMMADGMMHTVVSRQMDIDYQAYRPAILFLNGVYWGIHNIREKVGDDYVEENHGFDKDNLDLISQMNDVREGDLTAYQDLVDYVNTHDLSDMENYQYASSKIDVQEYINYNITQIFYANHDWPGGNIKFWRPRTETGRWRWILTDLDLAFQTYWLNTLDWATSATPPYAGSTDLFRGFMKNPQFSQLFLSSFLKHLNSTFSPDRIIGIIDSLQQAIQPEIGRHINRWKGYHGWTFANESGYWETGWLESYNQWLTNVDRLRIFAERRTSVAFEFLRSFYGLGAPVEIQVESYPVGSGFVLVNNDLIAPDGNTIMYFEDQELDIYGQPAAGYRFSHFEVTENALNKGDTIALINRNSTWKYYDQSPYPGNGWNQPDFNDAGWSDGCALLGYNDPDLCTEISYGPESSNKYPSAFFRKTFRVFDGAQWEKLIVDLVRDDGAVVYLNGTELMRDNMPTVSDYRTLALSGVEYPYETSYHTFILPPGLIRSGTNLIAVEVHQAQVNSSDLVFDFALRALVKNVSGDSELIESQSFTSAFSWKTKILARFEFRGVLPDLSINEVMPVNISTYSDHLGSYPDWVEVFNKGSETINLAGLFITDDPANPGKWQIPYSNPQNTLIEPGAFKVLFADEKPGLGADHLGFKLTSGGEMVGISAYVNNRFEWIDSLHFPELGSDVSSGRYPDGEKSWSIFYTTPTPGQSNKQSDPNPNGATATIEQNFPNPFSGSTSITLNVEKEAYITILIRDIRGNVVRVLTNQNYKTGVYLLNWDGRDGYRQMMSPGLYFYTLYSGNYYQTKKLLKLD